MPLPLQWPHFPNDASLKGFTVDFLVRELLPQLPLGGKNAHIKFVLVHSFVTQFTGSGCSAPQVILGGRDEYDSSLSVSSSSSGTPWVGGNRTRCPGHSLADRMFPLWKGCVHLVSLMGVISSYKIKHECIKTTPAACLLPIPLSTQRKEQGGKDTLKAAILLTCQLPLFVSSISHTQYFPAWGFLARSEVITSQVLSHLVLTDGFLFKSIQMLPPFS